ncbi:hypothetical protein PACILC2_56790 [Paenibacillus cisolokensis]|uniref:Uncharacterized protein n=1 Tax=Paenibacillus cisolokensis TaxID=1658519 RepID=A0ABQ4NGT9_9BACL|nr:hypothetical protein [Paenibacillus cisolokensis]GIQ67111.1 hypothetical protein PACILC2_56790 [Paenibacillus cisolokensis]
MADGGKTFNLDKETFMTFFHTYEEFRKAGIVPPAEKAALSWRTIRRPIRWLRARS